MSKALVISTWSFGTVANAAAWPVLAGGGAALDAVVAGATAVEDDPAVNSVGIGGIPGRDGVVSLDACVMTAPGRSGAVCYVRRYAHVTALARAVMEQTQHVMLAGAGAERFAARLGFAEAELLTEAARERWEKWRREYPEAAGDDAVRWRPQANVEEELDGGGEGDAARGGGSGGVDPNELHDTVGVLAVDGSGRLAGACSTSGMGFKVPGRVGDSPIIGHGLYVHPAHGAAVATGTGELAMNACAAHLAVELMRGGVSAADAAAAVVRRVHEEQEILPEHQLGVITLRPDGSWSSAALRAGFTVAVRGAGGERERVEPEHLELR